MSSSFSKAVKKREQISKRARDPESGRFEEVSPLNSPALRDQCVRWCRSMQELIPLLKGLAKSEGAKSSLGAWAGLTAASFECIRKDFLDALSFDPDTLKDAKKTWLTAPRMLSRNGDQE